MDNPVMAYAALFAQCLTAAASLHAGEGGDRDADYRVERQARKWFDAAMLLGEQTAEAENEMRDARHE